MPAKSPKMYIDGKWVDSSSGKTFEDHNPFTGDVYANVPAGTAEDARSAIDAAKAAFPEWAATPPAAKRQIFLKAADVMESRQDELVKAMMEEVGGTIGISMFQMGFVPGSVPDGRGRRLRRQGRDHPGRPCQLLLHGDPAARRSRGLLCPVQRPIHPGEPVVHPAHRLREHGGV